VKFRRAWNVIFPGGRNIWDLFVFVFDAFRIGTPAQGAMLPASFAPFCVAGAVFVYSFHLHTHI
jgi:hypothetical protein